MRMLSRIDAKVGFVPSPVEQSYPPSKSGFDYESVDPSVARFLKGQARRISQTSSRSIIQVGKDLLAAKHYLAHGAFANWVEQEVGIPVRTAQNYMQVANWTTGKSENVSHLPASLLYILSAPSAPKELVDDVLADVVAGKHIAVSSVRERARALRRGDDRRASMIGSKRDDAVIEEDDADVSNDVRLDREASLAEFVRVLRDGLSARDLERVIGIFARPSLRSDPELGNSIYNAVAMVRSGKMHLDHLAVEQ
ncbi:DUF3102 domain-containing protein [Bradyrhizobium sp. HKCCYLS2038]|uniref:DUF3102 domain-containing protein n=1 Tax=unclassified Bradyrhizobium TaxID=2631580 RepID=UPI003EBE9E4A